MDWVEPEGGIVAFPYLTDKSISSEEFARKLVVEAEVSLLPGEAFERPGFFRIGFGVRPETFKEAIERISDVLKK